MSDERDEDLEVRLIDVEETVVVASAALEQGAPGASRDTPGMPTAAGDDIQGMSYEEARDALVAVVDRLERGGSTLEESLALWERGEALAARCETWLIGARARLDAARGAAPAEA